MFSTTSRDFPKKLLDMPGSLHWCRTQTTYCSRELNRRINQDLRFHNRNFSRSSDVCKTNTKGHQGEVARLSRVHPFTFSKVRDCGNRPRIFCLKGHEYVLKDTKFRLFY